MSTVYTEVIVGNLGDGCAVAYGKYVFLPFVPI